MKITKIVNDIKTSTEIKNSGELSLIPSGNG